jgi:phenylpropionate dioxygenase-like ring-hydroxylating dioxygenase large terminal subunit
LRHGGIFPADGRCTAIYTAKSPALNDSKKCQLKQVLHKKTRKPCSGAGFKGLNDTE